MIRSCNYHSQAIRHIRDLLDQSTAQNLAHSLILSRLDYCKSFLHSASVKVVSRLQRLQHNLAHIVLKEGRRYDSLLEQQQLYWLSSESLLKFKVELLTYNVQSTSLPSNRSSVITVKRPAGILFVLRPFRNELSLLLAGNYRVAAPCIWNDLLVIFLKLILNTFLFNFAFNLVNQRYLIERVSPHLRFYGAI